MRKADSRRRGAGSRRDRHGGAGDNRRVRRGGAGARLRVRHGADRDLDQDLDQDSERDSDRDQAARVDREVQVVQVVQVACLREDRGLAEAKRGYLNIAF